LTVKTAELVKLEKSQKTLTAEMAKLTVLQKELYGKKGKKGGDIM